MTASPRLVGLLCMLAAGAALGMAFAAEYWAELVPCALCLVERWPYRIAAGLGLLAVLLPPRASRIALILLGLTVLANAVIGAVHMGVEFGWWPSPLPECAAPKFSAGSLADRLASMPLRPAKPCDDPSYLIPGVPLSLAGMNTLYALAFGGITLAYALLHHVPRRRRWR